jgi:hypothetical protein
MVTYFEFWRNCQTVFNSSNTILPNPFLETMKLQPEAKQKVQGHTVQEVSSVCSHWAAVPKAGFSQGVRVFQHAHPGYRFLGYQVWRSRVTRNTAQEPVVRKQQKATRKQTHQPQSGLIIVTHYCASAHHCWRHYLNCCHYHSISDQLTDFQMSASGGKVRVTMEVSTLSVL